MQSMLFDVRALDLRPSAQSRSSFWRLPSWPATFLHGERRRLSRCACCGRNDQELRKWFWESRRKFYPRKLRKSASISPPSVMARSRRTPARLAGRAVGSSAGRKLHRKIKKSQTPSEAERSAVPRTSPRNVEFYAQTELSSRPKRTRDLVPGALVGVVRLSLGGKKCGHAHFASNNRTCFLSSFPARWTTALSRVTSASLSRTARPSR